jgi:hypothetical protein
MDPFSHLWQLPTTQSAGNAVGYFETGDLS